METPRPRATTNGGKHPPRATTTGGKTPRAPLLTLRGSSLQTGGNTPKITHEPDIPEAQDIKFMDRHPTSLIEFEAL